MKTERGREGRSHGLAVLLLAVVFPLCSAASTQEPEVSPSIMSHDTKGDAQEAAVQDNAWHASQKETDFVLAEVRKLLESNPGSQIAELSLDPDYDGEEDTFLVNVVLEAHECRFTVGVMVKLHPIANGWETSLGYVD